MYVCMYVVCTYVYRYICCVSVCVSHTHTRTHTQTRELLKSSFGSIAVLQPPLAGLDRRQQVTHVRGKDGGQLPLVITARAALEGHGDDFAAFGCQNLVPAVSLSGMCACARGRAHAGSRTCDHHLAASGVFATAFCCSEKTTWARCAGRAVFVRERERAS